METETTKIKDLPFFVTFTYKEKSCKITLHDGQDLLKIANLFSDFLRKNDIDHIISIKPKI